MQVKVVGGDDSEVPTGEVGEIVLRSRQVFAGYWKLPEASATAVRDGWLRSRLCSHTARCVNRNYPTPSRADVRLDVPPEASALDCSAISPSPGRGRVCVCGNHAACPVACNQAKHRPC